jgi:hypothetical protein
MTRLTGALTLLLILGIGASTRAQVTPGFPNSPPPVFVFVAGVDKDKGTVVIHLRNDVLIPRAVPREVERKGIKVIETVTEYVKETRIITVQLSINALLVLDVDGKEVEEATLWKRLRPGTMVLQQSGVQPVDPAYRRVLARETLILATRPEGKNQGSK